ncbi:hypothetical protein M406DRAFT_326290 [Cryphonectria parasitica EP155]|uniref:Uncharacterized protein n=1 Tax=Cryphonectria parasitica (strain ATCC 38755 / EP155) TaxID=660469 RepID=A0A9P4YCC2_CRYP1|nr:uncharacterized protein M406DRAFT_326290 [Cryphonectria parasitica EP155]KAF3770872.1 hypothetical protein M406DRAFT_326290 [Cryphonectria parasitica EP155]
MNSMQGYIVAAFQLMNCLNGRSRGLGSMNLGPTRVLQYLRLSLRMVTGANQLERSSKHFAHMILSLGSLFPVRRFFPAHGVVPLGTGFQGRVSVKPWVEETGECHAAAEDRPL